MFAALANVGGPGSGVGEERGLIELIADQIRASRRYLVKSFDENALTMSIAGRPSFQGGLGGPNTSPGCCTVRRRAGVPAGARDLTLRLFDTTNNPILDAAGRAIVRTSRWDTAQQPTPTDAQGRWVGLVNATSCHPSDIPAFQVSSALTNQNLSAPAQIALLPETLYQARLVPALLHESFLNPIPGLVADGFTSSSAGRPRARRRGHPTTGSSIRTTSWVRTANPWSAPTART